MSSSSSSEGGAFGRDVVMTYGARIVAMALTAAPTVIVARALGPSDRGLVVLALGFVLLLVQMGTAGVMTANPYFLARGRSLLRTLVANSAWLAALIGAFLFGVGCLLRAGWPD